MERKINEKTKAIELRKKGYSYSEILKEVKVAKSTLSLWLRSVKLAKRQRQQITMKKKQARLKAVEVVRNKRKKITNEIEQKAIKDIGNLIKRDVFILGCALYWAEGSKQRKNNISQRVSFSNSDPNMIKIFISWLKLICKLEDKDIKLELYIHINKKNKIQKVKKFWKTYLGLNKKREIKIRFKKNIVKRSEASYKDYNGLLRVNVVKSTNLNRKIAGWVKGIIKNY